MPELVGAARVSFADGSATAVPVDSSTTAQQVVEVSARKCGVLGRISTYVLGVMDENGLYEIPMHTLVKDPFASTEFASSTPLFKHPLIIAEVLDGELKPASAEHAEDSELVAKLCQREQRAGTQSLARVMQTWQLSSYARTVASWVYLMRQDCHNVAIQSAALKQIKRAMMGMMKERLARSVQQWAKHTKLACQQGIALSQIRRTLLSMVKGAAAVTFWQWRSNVKDATARNHVQSVALAQIRRAFLGLAKSEIAVYIWQWRRAVQRTTQQLVEEQALEIARLRHHLKKYKAKLRSYHKDPGPPTSEADPSHTQITALYEKYVPK